MYHHDDAPLLDVVNFIRPQAYVIRLYVLSGQALFPRPNSNSNPVLTVSLGQDLLTQHSSKSTSRVNPTFHHVFEFITTLSGVRQLKIQVHEQDVLSRILHHDTLLGETCIDLEDRIFSTTWQNLGATHETSTRLRPKPVERRALHLPTSRASFGTLNCWLDILTPVEAQMYPRVNIALPAPLKFELRVVIWKARTVVSLDALTDQNDLFVKAWCESTDGAQKKQETDTHWRAKRGKGSFNWRMKFPLTLGRETREMKFPYFHVQLWDQDLVKWNDAIGEAMINCHGAFHEAMTTNERVQVFKSQGRRQASGGKNHPPEDENKHQASLEKEQRKTQELQKIQEWTGIFDHVDPLNSKWIKLERLNPQTQKQDLMGEICLSMEIIPGSVAEKSPVGQGRSEPISQPFLPPPSGRFQLVRFTLFLGIQYSYLDL